MEKPYTNEVEWRKTASIRRGLGIFAGLSLLLTLIGLFLAKKYVVGGGLILYLCHIPIREYTKKRVGWKGW